MWREDLFVLVGKTFQVDDAIVVKAYHCNHHESEKKTHLSVSN